MELNAKMNAHMNETLNIGGALLVKLFGRANEETDRFRERAADVRDIGIRRAVIGSSFFVILGLVSAVGTALVYGLGGYFVIPGRSPSAPSWPSARISVSSTARCRDWPARRWISRTSMVSFERVFEVLDLPHDIVEKKDALPLPDVKGELVFDNVTFNYKVDESKLLKDVKRYGRMEDVGAVFSSGEKRKGREGEWERA